MERNEILKKYEDIIEDGEVSADILTYVISKGQPFKNIIYVYYLFNKYFITRNFYASITKWIRTRSK